MPSLSPESHRAYDKLVTGVAWLDENLRFIHVNPAFIDITGLARWRDCPLEALGTAAPALADLIARARATHSTLAVRGFELATRDPPLRTDISVSADDDSVLIEIHAHGQHDSSARAAPRISQSLRGLAHEVKNPLAGLRGAAQLLLRRAVEPDQQRLADLIIVEADRLAALTDRLLRPGGEARLGAVNLHELSERALALISAEAAPELELDRDYDPSLPMLRGDADRLLQLLLNLLRNAMQAQASRIGVRTRAERGAVLNERPLRLAMRLDVIDNGAGVPDALRESLFLPLVSGRDEGTGLGLALAQEIAQEHGGQLDFTSRPGRTVFSLILPLEKAYG
jgi:two-component system nitrogen regulation sensor histidine kinase GlnL